MSIDIIERTCNNCIFFPCLKINCGKKCDNHLFEHDKLINGIEKNREE